MSSTAKTGTFGTITCPTGNYGGSQTSTITHEVGGGATELWNGMVINSESAFFDVGYTCSAASGNCGAFTMNCKPIFDTSCSLINNAYTSCNGDTTCNNYKVTTMPTKMPTNVPTIGVLYIFYSFQTSVLYIFY